MLHIPILRHGKPYESIDKVEIVHHATGEPVARVSQANAGLISRDVKRMDHDVLEQFTVRELVDMCRKAAEIFIGGTVPLGDTKQTFDDAGCEARESLAAQIASLGASAGELSDRLSRRYFALIDSDAHALAT
jgi:hypothetical protein